MAKETFKASRQSCVLTSYTHLLSNLSGDNSITPNVVFLAYIKYFRECHKEDNITADSLVDFGRNMWNIIEYEEDYNKIAKSYTPTYKISKLGGTVRELLSSIMLHFESLCIRNKVSGYLLLTEFDKRLHENNSKQAFGVRSNLSVVNSFFGSGEPISEDCKQLLTEVLRAAKENERAMLILYPVGNGFHSILVYSRSGKYYKIDPRYGIAEPFEWDKYEIFEYIIFEHKKNVDAR